MIGSAAVMRVVASVGGWLGFAVMLMAVVLWRQTLAARAEKVARACHELRGPLAAARLGVELTAARPSASAARLRAIELELDRAAFALDDLQGVSRPPGPATERGWVDVELWLRDSVEAWAPVAARRGVTLKVGWEGPPGSVEGERARLAQATGNLIANAIEHGGGAVEVLGKATERRVSITVHNDGPPLSPEVRQWLARGPGARARRPRGTAPGRGRGLAIARTVATAHGGRLTAEPTETGASLVLELPLMPRS